MEKESPILTQMRAPIGFCPAGEFEYGRQSVSCPSPAIITRLLNLNRSSQKSSWPRFARSGQWQRSDRLSIEFLHLIEYRSHLDGTWLFVKELPLPPPFFVLCKCVHLTHPQKLECQLDSQVAARQFH